MTDELLPLPPDEGDLAQVLRGATPARIFVGRSGPAYPTATQLALRSDHAAARDAVHAELDLQRDFPTEWLAQWKLFDVKTQAQSKQDYLLRPDLGRRLSAAAAITIEQNCPRGADLQIVIGDGLSAAAVAVQVPPLLPLLAEQGQARGWTIGRPLLVRHCRVGVMNDIGELLAPEVVVLLIGERPGLAAADSLSAYLAYRPRAGDTDAERNLVSNIHARGLSHGEAAAQILKLAESMRAARTSGVRLRAAVEQLPHQS